MAIINISFGYVGGRGGPTNHPPLFRETVSETKSSAATSSQSTNTAGVLSPGVGCAAARLYSDVAIWYKVGKNPTATTNTSMYLPAGGVEFPYVEIGDKIAVLEA